MTQPRIGDEAVKSKTGKDWQGWFSILDGRGARQLSHPEIVALLADYPEVSDWWKQSITVAYEQAHGLRGMHEMPGGFQISRSKTLPMPVMELYRWVGDDALRQRWLAEPLQVSTQTPGKSLRGAWADGSRIDMELAEKSQQRSSLTVRHSQIRNAGLAGELKSFWGAALSRLAEMSSRTPD